MKILREHKETGIHSVVCTKVIHYYIDDIVQFLNIRYPNYSFYSVSEDTKVKKVEKPLNALIWKDIKVIGSIKLNDFELEKELKIGLRPILPSEGRLIKNNTKYLLVLEQNEGYIILNSKSFTLEGGIKESIKQFKSWKTFKFINEEKKKDEIDL